MKQCSMCRESKSLEDFYKDRSTRDGLGSRCKECSKKRNKTYYEKNKDRELSRNKDYRDKHKDRLLSASRQHYVENIDYYKQYYVDNKHEINIKNKEWKNSNRVRVVKKDKEYRALNRDKIQSKTLLYMYSITLDQYNKMLEEQDYVCAICKQPNVTGKSLSVDHDHNCCPGSKSCGQCVRALLCFRCNTGLGHFRDDEQTLEHALAYIRKYHPNN